MEENWDEPTRRVWAELVKIYEGDRLRILRAILRVITDGEPDWNLEGQRIANDIANNINPRCDQKFVNLVIDACDQIQKDWKNFTTEPSPPSPAPPKAEGYNQLTLDFSATTELSPLGSVSHPRRNAPPSQEDEAMRSPTLFSNESIFLAIARQGTKKGWLTPQYKIKYAGGNSTTTNPHKVRQRTYGPYWVFCWPRPNGNDGRYYLGKATGKKFQHFCEVWKSSHSLEEVLRRLSVR